MSEPSINPYGAVDLSALANKAQQPPANSQARASGVVVDVTEEKFGELVELSNTVPVLVDLWSARTEQSTQLSALLEKTAVEYAGKFNRDRKSTRLNSSHVSISYAVFCLKKKKN